MVEESKNIMVEVIMRDNSLMGKNKIMKESMIGGTENYIKEAFQMEK